MKILRTRKIDDCTLLTTYDDELVFDSSSTLLYYETTGLSFEKHKLTLLSMAYNKMGNGHILQMFDWSGENEKHIIEKMSKYLAKFDNVIITYTWFSKFLNGKIENYGIINEIKYDLRTVLMKETYREFKPGFDINVEAKNSIKEFYKIRKNRDQNDIDNYLAYNRNHFLAYNDWLKRKKK
jgi:hypothetical protein